MDYSELCRIKDKLLLEVTRDIRPEGFSSLEAYEQHIEGIEKGVLRFFTQSVIELIDQDTGLNEVPARPKKSA